MSRIWTIFEKIFACLQVIIAGILFYLAYNFLLEDGEEIADKGNPHLRWSEIVNNSGRCILPFFILIGGLLLLFNKKAGWIITITLLIWVLSFIAVFGLTIDRPRGSEWFQFALFIAVILIPIGFLIQKPFLIKYKITKIDWAITAVFVILISLDVNWHRLF